jgi:hypothetical protein
LEVVSYLPHPDIDYSVYSVDIGERVYSDGNLDFTDRGMRRAKVSYGRFVSFVQWLEKRGGVAKFMHATTREMVEDDPTLPMEDRLLWSDIEGRRHIFGPVERQFAATKWKLHVRLPALLHTIQTWNSLPHRHSWVIERIAVGWTYPQIAMALGTNLATFLTWLTTNVDPVTLKSAWTARTVMMLESSDKLYNEAVNGDFDSECGRDAAESRAKVLSATNGHLRMQAVSRHEAYQPAKTNISVVPGSINITLVAPTLLE